MGNRGKIKKYDELFETSLGEDGLEFFSFSDDTTLDDFMESNRRYFDFNNIKIANNDGIYVLTNNNDDLYTISKEKDGYFVSFSLANGGMDEYFMPLNDILLDIPKKLVRKKDNVAPVDLMEYGIDKKSIASENEEEIVEKKGDTSTKKISEAGKVGLTTPEASIANNKDYNFDAMPGHKDTNPYYNNVNSKRIEIGSPNPVEDFKNWSGKFWRKEGEQHLKYEPNSGVSEEEETIELPDSNNSKDFVDIADAERKYKTWNQSYENVKSFSDYIKKED